MSTFSDSNRQIVSFNRRGDRVVTGYVPQLTYLQTEKEYIKKMVSLRGLDGMALLIDWDTRDITMIKYNDE